MTVAVRQRDRLIGHRGVQTVGEVERVVRRGVRQQDKKFVAP